MTLGLNREEIKQTLYLPKTVCKSELKDKCRLCQSNSLIWILPLLSRLSVTTKKMWRKKNGTQRDLKNQKIDNIEFRKNDSNNTENDSNAYE